MRLIKPIHTAITAIPKSIKPTPFISRCFIYLRDQEETYIHMKRGDSMFVRILRWIVSRLFFTLFPIFFSITLLSLIDKHASWNEVVGHGELFMISVSLIAPVIGNLLQQRRKHRAKSRGERVADIIITGGLLFQLMAAIGYFAGIKMADHLGKSLDGTRIITISVCLLIGSSLSVISCILRGNKVWQCAWLSPRFLRRRAWVKGVVIAFALDASHCRHCLSRKTISRRILHRSTAKVSWKTHRHRDWPHLCPLTPGIDPLGNKSSCGRFSYVFFA